LLPLASAVLAKPTPPTVPPPTKVSAQIDINTADEKTLQSIKGIGPTYAQKIIAGRPYKGKDDLLSKKIIPKDVYEKIKDQIIAKQPTKPAK